jgi:hypothetical protein
VGANDRAQNRKDDKARAAAEKRKRRGSNATSGIVADWTAVNGELLVKAVAAIAREGGALRLGYTRDGGAYAVGFYGDGEPFTEYVPPSDDMDMFLQGVIDDYDKA